MIDPGAGPFLASPTSIMPRLRSIAAGDSRISMIGHVSDQNVLRELWCNCHAYLHGHTVGGTNPALLRAMGYGSAVLASDTVFNREVLEDTGVFFDDVASVTARIAELDASPEMVQRLREEAKERIAEHYTWDGIADFNNQAVAKLYLTEFDTVWNASAPEHGLRSARRG